MTSYQTTKWYYPVKQQCKDFSSLNFSLLLLPFSYQDNSLFFMMADMLSGDKLLYFFMNHHLLTLFKINPSSSFQNWHGTRSSSVQCSWLVWELQNVTIPSRFLELLPVPSVIYPFLPPFSTN